MAELYKSCYPVGGVSLIDCLSEEEIREHVRSLRKGTSDVGHELLRGPVGSLCQLCAMNKLPLTPEPLYCACCDSSIRRNLIFYSTPEEMGGNHYSFCGKCFRDSKGSRISGQGLSFCKSDLQKGKNIKEIEESWVQCDKCEGWQHQICGLYNSENDSEGNAKYICPTCRLQEIRIVEHMPTRSPFRAKDLARTKLSDHIEQRLQRRLNEERRERAISLGKCAYEVPGAENLVVRVVVSVDKLLKVKQQFLDIFKGKNYPAEFPYKSKMILLFQKIEGVDVCLFAMYVQEYGSDCRRPNQRSVYISYIDSVNYFQPQLRTVHGEALRTFVYHEILIGYLEYCKKLGFETCYIWACPPGKSQDYILNCHPEAQKNPKSDKLRLWYKSMLLKAAKENIVVDTTNFYDRFFVPNAQSTTKVTTANLPYFNGAYWACGAEHQYMRFMKERRGPEEMTKSLMTKRALKSMGHTNLSGESKADIFVMQKLSEVFFPMKEDFMIVYLHSQSEIALSGVKRNTDDEDLVLDNDIFENRISFLSLCEKNHYQFDSLRRAKYSSMMILHHLNKHEPTQPLCVTKCGTKNKRLREQKAELKLEELLKTLLHALHCKHSKENPCCYPNCCKLKNLFSHASQCKVCPRGACQLCKMVWALLLSHSRICKVSNCQVPRCRDIKMSRKRKPTQADDLRRAAVEGD